MIYPIILCGGSGTRLWPLSRQSYPKQFSKLIGEKSLFQQSASRIEGENIASPIILTGEKFRFIVTEQLAAIEKIAFATIIEPEPKNTAPAILAAALYLEKIDPNSLMLVMPSDHIIPDTKAFILAVSNAMQTAMNGDLVTFGIKPNSPETGYGYIELNNKEDGLSFSPVKIASFVEKPNYEEAKRMLITQKYLWNSGIFLFKTSTIIEAFENFAKDMKNATEKALEFSKPDLNFIRLCQENWAKIEAKSIDYCILEKANNITTMPFNEKWSDLGSWASVWKESNPDKDGNVCSENATAIECKDTLLRSEFDGLEVVGIGLENIIAIAMSDAVVIAKKSESQKIRLAVDELSLKSKKQAIEFPKEHRPWGWYESLVIGSHFQVKKIMVKPGASLSLQSHLHRAEHWIVVEGSALITLNEEKKTISENQSIYIPIGTKHRLENPSDFPVILIEVQTGNYLGEDDIIRYQDNYSRN